MSTDHDLDLQPEPPFETGITTTPENAAAAPPFRDWNKGKILGQKR